MKRLIAIFMFLIPLWLYGTIKTNDRFDSVIALLGQKGITVPEKLNQSTIDSMQDLYQQIAALPIPEILDLLDEIVEQFDHIGTTYELYNPNLSWSTWLKKYWWVPPVTCVALIVMMLRYKKIAALIPAG